MLFSSGVMGCSYREAWVVCVLLGMRLLFLDTLFLLVFTLVDFNQCVNIFNIYNNCNLLT